MSPSNQSPRHQNDTRYAWGVCGFLLLAICLIYGQTLDHVLLEYDDSGFVFANPHVRAGLTAGGVRWALTDGPYGEWYPLAPLSHMLDCQLFGLNAWGHHLTNLLLHAAASMALFLVLWRMTGELWPSAFVAALFAVHPQHVESVAWVAERRDVLSGLLFMLTLLAWLGYLRHGRPLVRYLLVAALFALGLMSKPMLVTLPPLLLLLDFWPLARCGSARDVPSWTQSLERPGLPRLVLEKLPLAALAVGDCLMTLRTHVHAVVPAAWTARIGNAAVSAVTYIVQFFYPVDLAVFYPNPVGGSPLWKVAGALAILSATSAAAVVWRRKYPYLFVGWFWYLGMLTPVLGLVQVAEHAMADRYMYLPGIGLYISLAWGAAARGRFARAALGCGALRRSGDRHSRPPGRLANVVLVRRRDVVAPRFGRDYRQRRGRNLPGRRVGSPGPARRGNRRLSPGTDPRDRCHALDQIGALLVQEGKFDEAIAQYRLALAGTGFVSGACQPGGRPVTARSVRRVGGTSAPRAGNQPARRRCVCHARSLAGLPEKIRGGPHLARAGSRHRSVQCRRPQRFGFGIFLARKNRGVDSALRGGFGHRSRFRPGP